MFQESFEVFQKFQGCFMKVSRVFQGSFKGDSERLLGVFLSPKRQGSFKGVLRKFQGCFK